MNPIFILGLVGVGLVAISKSAGNTGGGSPVSAAAAADTLPDYSADGFIALFNQYGPQYGVPPLWLQAFCTVESNMGRDPSVIAGALSSDGKSKGIMQLTLATANDFESVSLDDLNNPDTSVRIAARFIQTLMRQFSVDDVRFTEWCVKSYNQGAGNTWKEIDGSGGGFANQYWLKWSAAYTSIGGNPTNYAA